MTFYNAMTSPPQLFVGRERVKNINEDYGYYDDLDEETWLQEPIEVSYEKLKKAIECLSIKCLKIEFGEYDPYNGTLNISNIECEYDDSNPEMLQDLKTDEVYMMKNQKFVPKGFDPEISGFTLENKCIALYFKK